MLMSFYTIRSERQLLKQIDQNSLFRRFAGFSLDDGVWRHSTFTKNRDRLLGGEVAHRSFALVLGKVNQAGLVAKQHFGVVGTLIEALASQKRYRPKDEGGPPDGDAERRGLCSARCRESSRSGEPQIHPGHSRQNARARYRAMP